jgi:hypothetical protein
MSAEGHSSFLLQLDTEQIPNIFDVKLNTDGTILNLLQNKFHTQEIGESIHVFANISLGGGLYNTYPRSS